MIGISNKRIALRSSKEDCEVGWRPQVVPCHAGNRAGRTQLVMPLEQVGPGHREEQAGLGRVALLVRRDGMDDLKKAEKDGDIGQDLSRAQSEKVQKMTDETILDVDRLLGDKEKEIMQV